jgi:hypothetical protein
MSDSSRRFGRFQVNLEATCDFNGQSHLISVLNLSVGGCFFAFIDQNQMSGQEESEEIVLPIENQVQLIIPLGTPDHTLVVDSKVAWVDEQQGYGCSFKRLKPLDVWSIIQFTRSPSTAFQIKSDEQIDHVIE